MIYYSTKLKTHANSLPEAAFEGMASDGGLFVPEYFPYIDYERLKKKNADFKEVAYTISEEFLAGAYTESIISDIIEECYPFDAPLKELSERLSILELFHGPTFAFKDFGARYMAALFTRVAKERGEEVTILAATSGDTGSAVASAFHNREGVKVILLYPQDKVSAIQKQQLISYDNNVKALEVKGTFDDCQAIVKKAFADDSLKQLKKLSSANSINIARLIPQSFYYASAYVQSASEHINVIVPSGNFGNLTAGLYAKETGVPVKQFIAAVNENKVIPEYLSTGVYTPKPSVATLANAMDVGNPSNFERILHLFSGKHESVLKAIRSYSISDDRIKNTIGAVFEKFSYTVCPHTACGIESFNLQDETEKWIVLATAHPAKFADIVEPVIEQKIELPEQLKKIQDLAGNYEVVENDYQAIKERIIGF